MPKALAEMMPAALLLASLAADPEVGSLLVCSTCEHPGTQHASSRPPDRQLARYCTSGGDTLRYSTAYLNSIELQFPVPFNAIVFRRSKSACGPIEARESITTLRVMYQGMLNSGSNPPHLRCKTTQRPLAKSCPTERAVVVKSLEQAAVLRWAETPASRSKGFCSRHQCMAQQASSVK